MSGTAGDAGLLPIVVFFAGPMLTAAAAAGLAYVMSDRHGVRVAFWALFAVCAAAGMLLLAFEPRLWRDLLTGRFYETDSEKLVTTRIVPWAAGCVVLIPLIRLIVRRRF